MIREPCVSGQFYPSNKKELEKIIESFKSNESSKISAKGIILPHAGYMYSGKVAVTTVNKIIKKESIIILGPKHTSYGESFSLWAKGKWRVPNADVKIDEDFAEIILKNSNYIKEDYLAHKFEHSIEVELPILYHFFGSFNLIPVACELTHIDIYKNIANELVDIIKKNKKDVLFIASTDMSHYEEEAIARKKDRIAIESIINLDAEDLIKKVYANNISMCGVSSVSILIYCLKSLGVRKAEVALYQTSGDVNKDYSSVVGYVGMIFS